MPRHVRNFWIELAVDGKRTRVATGPRGKDGGFEATISIRSNGNIERGMRIVGTVDYSVCADGRLTLSAYVPKNHSLRRDNTELVFETRR